MKWASEEASPCGDEAVEVQVAGAGGAGRRGRELRAPGAPPPSSSLLSQPAATARAWPQTPPCFTKNAQTLQPLESDVSGQ